MHYPFPREQRNWNGCMESEEDMFVFCENHTCKHNNGEVCRLHIIHIKVSVGAREDCSQGAVNICSNYEDRRKEDAGADREQNGC